VTPHGPSPADELIDVIDEGGAVISSCTRAEMRAGNLRHRTVCIVVATSTDDVVVHQRAPWKDVWPSYWDLAFGGVVAAGETWREAAVRELAEEAGIDVVPEALERLGGGSYGDDTVRELAEVFRVAHDGPVRCRDGEVVAVDTVARHRLADWCSGRAVVPDSRAVVLPLLTRP
jgi:8-oxo-dGTP pyrophosphatase MutT (NUDIX family)